MPMHVDEELLDARDVVDPQQGMVEARRADADHVARERVGVVRADLEAPGGHLAVEVDAWPEGRVTVMPSPTSAFSPAVKRSTG